MTGILAQMNASDWALVFLYTVLFFCAAALLGLAVWLLRQWGAP